MECPRPIKLVLPRFYPTWSSRTRPSMRIQRSEGLGSRLVDIGQHTTEVYRLSEGATGFCRIFATGFLQPV